MAFDMGALGNVVSGLAQGYGAYQQSKMANKLFKLQKQDYEDEKKRKKRSQARLNLGAERAFGRRDDTATRGM